MIQEMTELYPEAVKDRYNIEELGRPIEVLEAIAPYTHEKEIPVFVAGGITDGSEMAK